MKDYIASFLVSLVFAFVAIFEIIVCPGILKDISMIGYMVFLSTVAIVFSVLGMFLYKSRNY